MFISFRLKPSTRKFWSKLRCRNRPKNLDWRVPVKTSAEVIILGIIHRLVRNFDWGPSDRGFLAYFRILILTKIFEWRLVTKGLTESLTFQLLVAVFARESILGELLDELLDESLVTCFIGVRKILNNVHSFIIWSTAIFQLGMGVIHQPASK